MRIIFEFRTCILIMGMERRTEKKPTLLKNKRFASSLKQI